MFKPKKIIIILLSIILILPCVFIPVSAETVGTTVKSFSDFFSLSSAHLSYLEDGGDPNNTTSDDPWTNMTDSVSTSLINNSLILTLSGDKSWAIWEWLKVTALFDVRPQYVQQGFSSGSFWITIDNEWTDEYLFTPSNWSTQYGYKRPDNTLTKIGEKDNYNGDVTYNHYQKLTCNIPENKTSDEFIRLRVTFYIHLTSTLYSSESIKFNFNTLNVNLMTADEKNINVIVQNQNENADKITQNQDKNTQQIIDNQNQIQENEKNEANSTGDSGVNEIGSIIPNESQGFINSINNLVGTMSYNGTNCNWDFPSVSLPKIEGVMPEIKLWDKKEIPFEYWISQIPSGIMTLVQSLLTIALIVYCFKELYSIISYVLTLKGGGTSE